MTERKYRIKSTLVLVFIIAFLSVKESVCQVRGIYPPFTKWYQDPLGLKPLELSTAFGIVWSSAAAPKKDFYL